MFQPNQFKPTSKNTAFLVVKLTGYESFTCGFFVLTFIFLSTTVFSQETWRRAYGAYYDEYCVAVRAVSSEQFLMAGTTGSFGYGNSDIYLMSVDEFGEHQWSVTIGSEAIEQARDMRILPDGGMIIAGTIHNLQSGYDALLIRTNDQGEVLWQTSYGGSDWDFFNQIKVLDDGFIVAGETFSNDEPGGKAWLMRLDESGQMVWEHKLAGTGTTSGYSVSSVQNDGFVMVGSIVNESIDGFAARFSLDGDLLWKNNYGGDSLDIARDVVVCQDGTLSIVGTTASYSPHTEAWHLKLTDQGEELWYRNWGQIDDQESYEHYELSDGSFITIGYTTTSGGGNKDMFLLKSASDGAFVFGRTFGYVKEEEGFGLDVLDDGFICGGYTKSYGYGSSDVYLVRTNLNGQTATQDNVTFFDPLSADDDQAIYSTPIVYPNPASEYFYLNVAGHVEQLRIFSTSGQLVHQQDLLMGEPVRIDLPNGLYQLDVILRNGELKRSKFQIVR